MNNNNKSPTLIAHSARRIMLLSALLPSLGLAQNYVAPSNAQKAQAATLEGLTIPGGIYEKVANDLVDLQTSYLRVRPGKPTKTLDPTRPVSKFMAVSNDYVVIDAVAAGDPGALHSDLLALGGLNVSTYKFMVSARIPITMIDQLGKLKSLRFVNASYAVANTGSVTSQGDAAQLSNDARAASGVDGTGVTVGVISDSYNCLGGAAADVSSGDLPTTVNIVQDSCPGNSDEGRAILQIIHDVAPGANLAFHTGFGGQANFANGIDALVAANASIIIDDVFYFGEPMFMDGIIAQAADNAVAGGVAYFSAAGNSSTKSYESPFVDSGLPGILGGTSHDFDPGPNTNNLQRITVPVGASFTLSLQWNQPFFSVTGTSGATTNLNIYVIGADLTRVLKLGRVNNISTGDPNEVITFTNTGVDLDGIPGPDTTFYLLIEKREGVSNPIEMKYMFIDQGGEVTIDTFDTASGASYGHASAVGVESVGAAAYFSTPDFGTNPPALESYSSRGNVPIHFTTSGAPISPPELRLKPEITAPDGGNTTFFGSDNNDSDSFPNFFGTSAAAPHAAGVAALMREVDSSLTPAEIYSALESTAIDILPAGFDFDSGHGLIQATTAIDALSNVSPTLDPIPGQQGANNDVLVFPLNYGDTETTAGNMTLTQTGMPGFCSFNPGFSGTGNITCTLNKTDIGRFTVVVTAIDNGADVVPAAPSRSVSRGFYVVAGTRSQFQDMNGDSLSDILWRNVSTGQNWLYLMNGASIDSSVGINTVDPLWQIAGNGDYNGDNKADILWRNSSTGQNWMYLMNGSTIENSVGVNTVPSVWEVVGNGDFDGDGNADILWRNTVTGQNWLYLMNGAAIVSSLGVNTVGDTDWEVAGNGDYNGDGKADILWRNIATGQNWLYLMSGATIDSSIGVNTVPIDWQIASSGDYNGDGNADILWRNSVTGQNWLYLMTGAVIDSSVGVNTVSADWQFVGDGDYNDDGRADILWRNTVSGQNWVYLMNGATIDSSLGVNTVNDLDWQIVTTP